LASVINSDDLGQSQTSPGQGTNNIVQPGQATNTSTANQAGQAPVQSQSGAAPTNPQGSGSQPAGSNSTPSAGGSGGGNQAATVNDPNKQQGSGYTNIQKVVNANQGNQLGSAIGNNLQQTTSSAQQNLQNAQGQFNQQTQANQANTQQNQQLVQNVLNDPTQYANIASATSSQNPTNAQQGQQFQNLISGQYQGPTALNNASALQNQAAQAAQEGQALGTSGGRIALLQQAIGNPQYTQGQAGLDELLLGQSNSPALAQAKQQALTLQGQVNTGIAGAAAQGQQQTAQAQQFGTALQNQLGATATGLNNTLQQQATNAQQANNTQYQNALAALQSGNVTQQEANLLGLTQGENVYNVLNGAGTTGNSANNAAQFLQENPNQATAGNIATAQQYAQMQALQQLGGQYAPQNAQTAFQNYQNPSQAGTYAQQQNLIGNQTAFQNALNSTQSNYNSIAAQPAQNYANAQNINNIMQQVVNHQIGPQQADALLSAAGYGGAVDQGGNILNQIQWAQNNLTTTQAAENAAQQQLQSQFGPGETVNIIPTSNYPAIAGATS